MSTPGPVFTNIHQIGNTLAWCILLDIAVVSINLRYRQNSVFLHTILGWTILALLYIDILLFLIPNGFNVTIANGNPVLLFIHGIIGLCMMAFIVMQVAGGVIINMQLNNKQANIPLLEKVKKGHRFCGYCLAIIYKINVIWAWIPTYGVMAALLLWEICFCCLIVYLKRQKFHIEAVITDEQFRKIEIKEVYSTKELDEITKCYIIFQDYAYHAKEVLKVHPGGNRVIETVIGRQVDRFLYGMYSSQLLPQLPPHSHSSKCLRLSGLPFAKLVIPPTYDGFTSDIMPARISFMHVVSEKTHIYELGLVVAGEKLAFKGYSSLLQLGQYYSLTINDEITRLYTAVNFLTIGNVDFMLTLIPELQSLDLYKNNVHPVKKMRQTELAAFIKQDSPQKQKLNEGLLGGYEEPTNKPTSFLPIMLKVYPNGKLTSMLKQSQFMTENLKLSCPRGRGLELDITPPGKIIVLAGGTGLFPFCDFIDLLFKERLLEEGHAENPRILRQNPLLQTKPFAKYSFLFLIALHEPDDIHPITLHQLIYLSNHAKNVQVVFRMNSHQQKMAAFKSKFQFTKEYFNKRVLSEAAIEGLSRIWICGPPRLSSDTAKGLLEKGFKRECFLLI